MSTFEMQDDLPEIADRGLNPVWAAAKANPGKWLRSNLRGSRTMHARNHPGFDITQRQGALYVRWPAPTTNGRKRR